jgi:RelA/SpoT family (p)ppGpp synthetase
VDHFEALKTQLLTYLPQDHIAEFTRAYLFAKEAHEGQTRCSGEPYISHPVEVACILAAMQMDPQSIIAAILHDVIEDTPLDKKAIAEHFGPEVADLVDGVSKLALIKFETRAEAQAENLRKMMLAMAKDIRVIIIKLADRLHNLRTLDHLPLEKRRRIARETLEIYAPIAHRLGMNHFRIEFEDIGFSHLYPIRYKVLANAVRKARENRTELIHQLEVNLKSKLEQENIITISLMGREKHLYSLYKKMQKKEIALSEIMDVYALRILVDKVDTCYRVLGVIHQTYKPVHGRFKDYIAIPKSNGYQSLHTTVLGPFGVPVEIQIRTQEMDRMAENGIAAHWLYKIQEESISDAETRARNWLTGVLELQKNTGNSLEFIEHVKIDLYPDEVYVFTPDGDILSLPSGATIVDFAYAVHTDVGNACIAARMDRRMVPLSTRLKSGQTVEVVTAEGAHPNPAWLSFVVTSKARTNIRHWLKTQELSAARDLGKRLIDRALVTVSLRLDEISENRLDEILKELKFETLDALYVDIGLGNQIASLVARKFLAEPIRDVQQPLPTKPLPFAIRGTEGMAVTFSKCCKPIPGDAIIGCLNAGRGIVVHRELCKHVADIYHSPEKYIFLQWADKVEGEFYVELQLDVLDKRGMLAILTNVLADYDANIENVHIDKRDGRHNTLTFLIQIHNRVHLARIIRELRTLDRVTRVTRI